VRRELVGDEGGDVVLERRALCVLRVRDDCARAERASVRVLDGEEK